MANTIQRTNPGDLSAGDGLTFRTNLNSRLALLFGHTDSLERETETFAGEYAGKGTMPGNTAELYIDNPVSGRVYCPVNYKAVIGGAPVITLGILEQGYTGSALNHVYLVVATDGALSLRVATGAVEEAANELWIADVTAVPEIENEPTGKVYAWLDADNLADLSITLGDASDGSPVGKLDARYQVYTTNATPDTEDTIAHGLGRTPVGYVVVCKDKAGDVYKGTTAWDGTNIYLKCSIASVAVTILVF